MPNYREEYYNYIDREGLPNNLRGSPFSVNAGDYYIEAGGRVKTNVGPLMGENTPPASSAFLKTRSAQPVTGEGVAGQTSVPSRESYADREAALKIRQEIAAKDQMSRAGAANMAKARTEKAEQARIADKIESARELKEQRDFELAKRTAPAEINAASRERIIGRRMTFEEKKLGTIDAQKQAERELKISEGEKERINKEVIAKMSNATELEKTQIQGEQKMALQTLEDKNLFNRMAMSGKFFGTPEGQLAFDQEMQLAGAKKDANSESRIAGLTASALMRVDTDTTGMIEDKDGARRQIMESYGKMMKEIGATGATGATAKPATQPEVTTQGQAQEPRLGEMAEGKYSRMVEVQNEIEILNDAIENATDDKKRDSYKAALLAANDKLKNTKAK